MRWMTAMLLGWAVASLPAKAEQVVIGLAAAPTSADPYFHALTPNNMLAHHMFSALIDTDPNQRLVPALATGWTLGDSGSTWTLALRPGVRFHDGTPFTAADVVYSLCRVLHPSGPTGSFQAASRGLDQVEVLDPLTVKLRMRVPDPAFLSQLAALSIISARSAGAGAMSFSVADGCGAIPAPAASAFDGGAMANGTGPYRLAAYSSGEQVTLAGNAGYFGPKPNWDRVVMRALPNAGARLAGLLSGDVDLIENPSAQDLPTIKARGGLTWAVVQSNRLIFLQPDVERDPSPAARGRDGHNPLRDPRVRQAISLAIDRKAIASRLMDGMAVPADRYAAPGTFGGIEGPVATVFDPQRARRLIQESGAEGMTLTLSATRDRYIADAAVAQAIGQYLTRIGIQTTVEALPQVSFFPGRTRREFSLSMGGWGYSSEGAANMLRTWLATPDPVAGIGGSNYGGYRNTAFNQTLVRGLAEMDDGARVGLLQAAERTALADHAIIPLYWETSVWAFKDRFAYAGRADQRTDADDLSLKGK